MLPKHTLPYFFLLLFLYALPAFARGDSEERHTDDDTHYAAIIKIDSDDALPELEQMGVTILRQRENLLLCYIPVEVFKSLDGESRKETRRKRTHEIKEIGGVVALEVSRKVSRSMDVARQWFDAYTLHSGEANGIPYSGKGVVTGLCDIGIDPLHIAFQDKEGRSRIKRISQYKEGTGERIILDNEAAMRNWKTDTEDEWHATHVANIMAGSEPSYLGMAPESEIVVSTSQLTDVGLLCGAEDILEYAKENGKRAVINMSMANYLGPHDGSTLFSQYIDLIAEEAVVVLSAGNGGRNDFTLPFTFSDQRPTAPLAIYSTDWIQFTPYGAVDVWSSDHRQFNIRFGIQDGENKVIEWMYPWQTLTEGASFKVTTDPDAVAGSKNETLVFDSRLGEYFSGWFSVSGEIDEQNGRYHAVMQFDAKTEIESSNGKWARYIPVVEVGGEPGVHVDIYADGQYTVFRSLPGGPTPSPVLSFSDLACGFNTISVGMFTNRNERPSLEGEVITGNHPAGAVSPYSSYSTLSDGRVMPQTVAPGGAVVSAISNSFIEKHGLQATEINAVIEKGNDKYYWASNTGTSMSAPYVAGTIACWLEAAPSLSPAEIRDIIESTNRHDYPDADNPRHGRGWFDPVAGLKEAIKRYSGVEEIEGLGKDSGLRLTFSGADLTIWNPGAEERLIEVYSISGVKAASWICSESVATFSLSSLTSFTPGVYIARIAGTEKSLRFIAR